MRIISYICTDILLLTLTFQIMDLQIKVYKCFGSSDEKPLFKQTICDLPACFSYETIVEAMKLLYGNKCIIQMNII